ncbi:MAG: 8-amino-7-oxononanoate synthase [Steroidobacteraceae bacterium]
MRLDSARLRSELEALEARHERRRRRLVEAIPDPARPSRVRVDGRELLNFCNNDYLGLRTHPSLIEAAAACMRRDGFGAGAAHLLTGHSREHHALEAELAAFTGRERALLFSSGYMANLGVISALSARHDGVLADRLNHASLLDGARLSGARLRRYAHLDALSARAILERHPDTALIVTDGVFSMDGDIAPLRELAALAQQYGAWLMVDDAHGLGVLGALGRGSLEHCAVDARAVPILVGTLGKALGSFGAFVAGDAALIDTLIQRARSYVYTTALPPAIAAATRAALRLVQHEPWRRERLRSLVQRFRAGAASHGLPLMASSTPIQPLLIGESARALRLSEALEKCGFWVGAIRPPTVPRGSARLRVTLSAAHSEADVDALLQALAAQFAQRTAA